MVRTFWKVRPKEIGNSLPTEIGNASIEGYALERCVTYGSTEEAC